MTNQTMIISDEADSCLAMTIPRAMSPAEYFATRKFLKRVQGPGNQADDLNAMLDSMRASSPTRRAVDGEDGKSWMHQHPSALSMFGEITANLAVKQIVVFLDYDGTLSPIVEDPNRAFMTSEMRAAVRDIARLFPTAIISGRCRAKVYNFVRLPELYYAGSHGMDIQGPSRGPQRKGSRAVLCQPAREFLPIIDEVYECLVEKIKHIPGAKVENNRFCLSVHYRCVEEKRWGEVANEVESIVNKYDEQLRLNQGRKVLEIRPAIKWNKGHALEFLLESLGYAESSDVLPVYIGDDHTDEDAFKVLHKRGQGLGILVSRVPKETNASYTLQEPSEVMHFLKRLVEWKKRREDV